MPPGWKRVPVPESELRLYPDGCSRYLFEHESMLEPYGRLSEWYYPFPVSEIQESTPPFMSEPTQYLFCETSQARLSGYQQGSVKLQYSWDNETKLCDGLGKDIGKLHLPNEGTRNRFPENVNGGETGLQVDIVAVCRLKRCSRHGIEKIGRHESRLLRRIYTLYYGLSGRMEWYTDLQAGK